MFLVVLFFVAFGAVNGQMEMECAASSLDLDCSMELADYYTLHWTANETHLVMAAEGATEGWVGFAFAEIEGMMAPADFVIGYVADGAATVNSYRSEIQAITANDLDASVPLSDVQGTEEDGMTTIYFTRSIDDGMVDIDLTSPVVVNYAIGEEDELAYHGPTTRGWTSISFA